MIFSNADSYKQCIEIVKEKLVKRNISVNDDALNKIAEDVMNISYAKGGDYSCDTIQSFAEVYVEEGFYKKYLN